jgi:Zn-dependent protease with chaperone function
MLKVLSRFSSNTDFYNPAGKPLHDLLSRKEKIKGRALPLLAQVSLFALSTGMSMMNGTAAETVLAIGILASVVSYLRHSSLSNYKKALHQENVYDPDVLADAARFAQNYPVQAGLFTQLRSIAAEAGLEKAPLVHVGKNVDYAAIIDLGFGKKKELLIEFNNELLVKESPASLLHMVAHEIGHARLGHTDSLPAVVSGTATATHISVGVQMALAGNYLGGIFYSAAAVVTHRIAAAKRQQYKERECDRQALLLSGVGPEAAAFFEKETVTLEKDSPLALRLAFGAISTYQSLLAQHPSNEKRGNYMRAFSDINRDALEKTRIKNGLAPRNQQHFKMV